MKKNNFDYSIHNNLPEINIRTGLLYERMKELVGKRQKVLEVGLGSGDVTLLLLKIFEKVVCVDSDEKSYENLVKRINEEDLSRIKFINSRAENVDLTNSKYDNIVLFNILEHVEYPSKFLRKLSNSLSKNGTMYIVVNLANSIHRQLGVQMGIISKTTELGESDIKLGHYRVYTKQLIRKHVRESGLEKVFEQPFYLKPFPTKMLPLSMEIHRGLDLLGREYPELASYIYMEVIKN